ncbi:MAG: bifunctional hydroxymethylpyrimidine kinase/phosphomethylpyrimidine kinase [Acidimicrobiales bacterium]
MTISDPPVALTIAGSDSGSGAGIQADIKSMGAVGVFATVAVTAVTAQNTTAVTHVHYLPTAMVEAQIDAVLDDLHVRATKTGMLGTAGCVTAVGRRAAAGDLPRLVVDPVMVASTGRVLLADEGVGAYRCDLLPHALVATPNLWEAALLAGMAPSAGPDIEAMTEMARRIHELGPVWVLVKGGHLPGVDSHPARGAPDLVTDILFDGTEVTRLTHPHVDTPNTHGTGCSLSAAIAAYLAHGMDVPTSVTAAREFVHTALLGGAGWRLGRGHGPLDHLGWSPSPAVAPRP